MTTYGTAVARLVEELGRHDFEQLVQRSGAGMPAPDRIALRCLGQDYLVSYPQGEVVTAWTVKWNVFPSVRPPQRSLVLPLTSLVFAPKSRISTYSTRVPPFRSG